MDKIAYLIICHKNEKQVTALVDSLLDEYADVYVHVDKKNGELYQRLRDNYNEKSGVYILHKRVAVSWGGSSQLKAIIALINAMLHSGIKYSYASLISGQDLLIKPHIQFYRYLETNYPQEFIELERCPKFDARVNTFQLSACVSQYAWARAFNYFLRYIYNHFHVGVKRFCAEDIYKGGEWWTLTGTCLKRIIDYVNENPAYLEKFKYTICSDEHFVQMLIKKLGMGEQVKNDNLRYIDWNECKDNPKILTNDDYSHIMASSAFIGRKFDMDKDSVICDKLLSYSRKKEC